MEDIHHILFCVLGVVLVLCILKLFFTPSRSGCGHSPMFFGGGLSQSKTAESPKSKETTIESAGPPLKNLPAYEAKPLEGVEGILGGAFNGTRADVRNFSISKPSPRFTMTENDDENVIFSSLFVPNHEERAKKALSNKKKFSELSESHVNM